VNQSSTGVTLGRLGEIYRKQGIETEAEKHFLEAIKLLRVVNKILFSNKKSKSIGRCFLSIRSGIFGTAL
jgi:hypothetical protein